MRISDWSSDVCSSDLLTDLEARLAEIRDTSEVESHLTANNRKIVEYKSRLVVQREEHARVKTQLINAVMEVAAKCADHKEHRSEEHTSELQSLMRISYAVFCLKKKNSKSHKQMTTQT